jgi:N-acetyl-anhydromuramoyl-L-alanine amidase
VHRRAWHAGLSRWRGRERCNDFSIGIELEGTDREPFAAPQYASVAALIAVLRQGLRLRHIAAHSEVAPGRKSDPGAGFEWRRLLARLANH